MLDIFISWVGLRKNGNNLEMASINEIVWNMYTMENRPTCTKFHHFHFLLYLIVRLDDSNRQWCYLRKKIRESMMASQGNMSSVKPHPCSEVSYILWMDHQNLSSVKCQLLCWLLYVCYMQIVLLSSTNFCGVRVFMNKTNHGGWYTMHIPGP